MKHLESELQKACITWFDLQHSDLSKLLFNIANGGKRDKKEAARLKLEGVRPGVPDLCLAIPNGKYSALYIELKTDKGSLSDKQEAWLTKSRSVGNLCVVIRNIGDFIKVVSHYLIGYYAKEKTEKS